MKPDVDHIYVILRQWATSGRGRPQTYSQLSEAYHAMTGVWFEPHGSWDLPLGELNTALAAVQAPALSALVVLRETKEPGDGFWGCAPNVPPRPRSDIDRLGEWSQLVKKIIDFPWPPRLP